MRPGVWETGCWGVVMALLPWWGVGVAATARVGVEISASSSKLPPDALLHNRLGVESLDKLDIQAAIFHFNASLVLAQEDEEAWLGGLTPMNRCRFRRNLALSVVSQDYR